MNDVKTQVMNAKKIKAGVIGDPISHSLSPKIHNFFLEKYSIKGSYEAIQIKKDELAKRVQELVNKGFSGFNVTIPHKEEIFKICHHTSKTAQLTKAVNTVVVMRNNQETKLFGHNSDPEGFLKNLENSQVNFDLKNKTVFLIGAGGAARAVVYALLKSQVKEIFITNRNQNRAEILINDFVDFAAEKKSRLQFLEAESFTDHLASCDLLINSTALGMVGQDRLEINLTKLKKSAVVYDIVYKPLETELLFLAKQKGNEVVDGLGMLIEQALVGFEMWFKEKPKSSDNWSVWNCELKNLLIKNL